MVSDLLDVSVVISTPLGDLELEDPVNGYTLHADSHALSTITHRKTESNNPWLEGTYAVDSVRDNTQEALVVWVKGDTHYEWEARMALLMAALDQLTFTVTSTFEDARKVWDCEVSDYTRETQQEYIFAKQGIVRATIMRRPAEVLTRVAFESTGFWPAVYLSYALGLDYPVNFTDPDFTANGVALADMLSR